MELNPEPRPEIAHVLTIDIVAYSTLLIDEQSEMMAALNKAVRNAPCFRAAEVEGKLTRLPTGDGMALVFFGNPEAPLECAMQITSELKARADIRLRMGIHSGPIKQVVDVNDRSNVAGAGIDTAQRVMDCGDAGHILVSKRVADDLVPDLRWHRHLHDLGECEVKHGRKLSIFNFYTDQVGNSALPEKLKESRRWTLGTGGLVRRVSSPSLVIGITTSLTVIGLAVWFWALPRGDSGKLAREKSIAVLPFENRSEEQANAYFADGIQDEVLTRLAAIADLKVISRTSTQHYKSAPENLPEIARQLGVAYILEGSVQKSGNAVRINVQLIRAASDTHVWAETFDRTLTDIFSVQTDVARAIANQLRARLSIQEQQLIAAKPTTNPEAYDAYLRGLALTLKPGITLGNTLGAQKYLRQAIELDPGFALSWALLSFVNSLSYLSLNLQPTEALREEARHAAETALYLEPNLGEALHAIGFYHYACLKDYGTAVQYFEKARRLLPNSSLVPVALAYVARRQGEWERSEAYFQEAERLDPLNVNLLTQRAHSYAQLRRFPKALQKLDQVLAIAPHDVDTIAIQAGIAQAEGDLAQAAALLAPLRPTVESFIAVEQQVYQAILEGNTAPVIVRLKEILAAPDPARGYINGELRFWLGWAQEVAADSKGAEESWRQARTELEFYAAEQPQNFVVLGDLALVNMGLGDYPAAIALAERAAAVTAIQKDAIAGPLPLEIIARVAARMGDSERSLSTLKHLLSIPYEGALASGMPLTPALLRLDPMFHALRDDAGFAKLATSSSSREGRN